MMRKLHNGLRVRYLAILLAAASGVAHAATQGTLGSTSTGSLGITLTIPNLVQITGINDIALGTWSGGAMSGSDNVCVFSTTRAYRITANGSGTAGAFTLVAGANTIPYTVEWDDVSGATTGTALTSGTALTGQATAATSATCGGGTNATVIVRVAEAALTAVPAGAYTGTLTLVITPE